MAFDDDTKMTIQAGDGEPVETSLKQMEAAVDRLQNVQLSFDVHAHPSGTHGLLGASLKISGEYLIGRDLQPGDALQVVVQDADGEVVATAPAEVATVGFAPIKDDGVVIGMERVHKAKIE